VNVFFSRKYDEPRRWLFLTLFNYCLL